MRHVVALFGEAEKGPFQRAHYLQELPQLIDLFGNPPADSQGLFFAIQALLFQRELIYFRVEEEGFSHPDYYSGIRYLESKKSTPLHAICMPGVGDREILDSTQKTCQIHKSF